MSETPAVEPVQPVDPADPQEPTGPPLPKVLEPKNRSFWNIVGESLVVAGLAVSISLAGYIVVQQYTAWRQRQLMAKIQPSTTWVESSRPVFIIHYKDLWRIGLDGSGATKLFEGSEVLRECVLSPDGKSIVVRVADELYWVDAASQVPLRLEALELPKNVKGVRGSFNGIVWARDSKKFIYKVSRWSPVASVESVKLFDVEKRSVEAISSSGDSLPELAWDWEGKNLFFVRSSPGEFSFLNKVRLYRISIDTKKIEPVAEFDSEETKISRLDLAAHDVKLYVPAGNPSFKKLFTMKSTAVSVKGKKAGLDKNNFVYLVNVLGRPQRQLELPWGSSSEFTALDYMDWVPGDRYLLLFHRSEGILVLDTLKRKVGRLIDLQPQAIAWGPE